MVKRKSLAPRRLTEETRDERTWNLAETSAPLPIPSEVIELSDSEDVEYIPQVIQVQPKKKVRRKSNVDNSVDIFLQEILSDCEFYVTVKRNSYVNVKGNVYFLGKITLDLQEMCDFPDHDVFWIYVSKTPYQSFVYFDAKTPQYYLLKGQLDVDFFSGLANRCFNLQLDDVPKDSSCVCLRVLLLETWCQNPVSINETKLRNLVISHFYEMSAPAFGENNQTNDDLEALYQSVKEYHENEEFACSIDVQHTSLVPMLRPYQHRAVQWMLHREATAVMDEKLCCLYTEIETCDGKIFYYNKYAGCIVLEKPVAPTLPTGGILADEMGLGKTVEVLACILGNPCDMETIKTESEVQIKPLSNEKEVENLSRLEGVTCNSQVEEHKGEVNDVHITEQDCLSNEGLLGEMNICKSEVEDEGEVEVVRFNQIKKESGKRVSRRGRVVKRNSRKLWKRKEGKNNVRDTVQEIIEDVILKFSSTKTEPEPKKTPKRKSVLFEGLEKWYKEMLQETTRKVVRRSMPTDLECVCGEESSRLPRVSCMDCGRWQHARCMGNPRRDMYRCPRCWQAKDLVVSGATLIVSPSSISNQWLTEIQKHIKDPSFSVLVYRGLQKEGFVQPNTLASHHLVLTTYETLRKELVYADLNGAGSPRLRHSKRFFASPSPLPCVRWWRICLDEAQMVEHVTSKTAEMTRRLEATHRWAITGTPIQKSIQDLFGLVQFLGVQPYSDLHYWTYAVYAQYCRGDRDILHRLLGAIMWRTMKKDVLNQINIPTQNEEVHWLNFSPVEEHFYRIQHMMCSADFQNEITRIRVHNVPLKSLHRVILTKVLAPLLRLRQACTHHMVVRGFHVSQKDTMTMDELLESLLKKTKLECEEALRQYIAALNGLAAIHIINEQWGQAVESYRSVLRLSEEYKNTLQADKLQMIHTLYNLADILSSHPTGIPATLRDHLLQQQASELEQKYMHKSNSQVVAAQETLTVLTQSVRQLEGVFQTDRDEWWAELLGWCSVHNDKGELLSRIQGDLLENKMQGQNSIINRVKNMPGLEYEVGVWSEALTKTRQTALKNLRELEVLSELELVNEAVDCHLRTNPLNKKKKCRLCCCEMLLKKYESLLFAVSSKQTEHSLVGDVLLLGQLNQGTWKACEMERVLRVVVAFGRSKRADKELLEDGAQYLKLLEALKKEFKQLRHTWTHLRDQVSVRDELHMAKLRLRVRFPDEPRSQSKRKHNPLQQLSSNLSNKVETIHIIEQHEVGTHAVRLDSDRLEAQGELRRKTGQLQYLHNLGKNQGCKSNPDPCPICQTELGDKWTVLQCGHCFCIECIQLLLKTMGSWRMSNIKCAICRDTTKSGDISFVDISSKGKDKGPWPNISVQGSHSTKVEAVVKCLLALKSSQPDAKVLVFSTWEKVLDVLQAALRKNDISFRCLKAGCKHQQSLQDFKETSSKQVMVLLMPLRWGAKGLNLTEATHVLLVEPILNPADELQAIGRVHRFGQSQQTVVHKFLVRGTIEERMYEAVHADSEKWSDNCITIHQLKDLFSSLGDGMSIHASKNNATLEDTPTSTAISESIPSLSTSHSVTVCNGSDVEEGIPINSETVTVSQPILLNDNGTTTGGISDSSLVEISLPTHVNDSVALAENIPTHSAAVRLLLPSPTSSGSVTPEDTLVNSSSVGASLPVPANEHISLAENVPTNTTTVAPSLPIYTLSDSGTTNNPSSVAASLPIHSTNSIAQTDVIPTNSLTVEVPLSIPVNSNNVKNSFISVTSSLCVHASNNIELAETISVNSTAIAVSNPISTNSGSVVIDNSTSFAASLAIHANENIVLAEAIPTNSTAVAIPLPISDSVTTNYCPSVVSSLPIHSNESIVLAEAIPTSSTEIVDVLPLVIENIPTSFRALQPADIYTVANRSMETVPLSTEVADMCALNITDISTMTTDMPTCTMPADISTGVMPIEFSTMPTCISLETIPADIFDESMLTDISANISYGTVVEPYL